MAKVVGGFASSHTPLMYMKGEDWGKRGEQDRRNRELVKMPEGFRVTYDELEAIADKEIAKHINVETFMQKEESIQRGLDELERRFGQTDADVVVMFGDDQSEFFFDDNMPSINVYWGKSIKLLPRPIRDDMTEAQKMSSRAYGTEERDYPVASDLGLHIIESLMEQDFDPSHSQYTRETYGGKIGPATWYLDMERSTQPRPFGLPHAFGFPIARWWNGKSPAIVPISINTCYPPNWISPRRAFALGRAVRKAIENWNSDARVAFATSGGLSHFVVDEELDRQALKGLSEANADILTSLPRHRLQSATTETLNWVATAGAMGDTKMDVICYEPGYRTPAGTGCGCAVGSWL
jgi:3-O-methylgallate 3,4-dioxygenase